MGDSLNELLTQDTRSLSHNRLHVGEIVQHSIPATVPDCIGAGIQKGSQRDDRVSSHARDTRPAAPGHGACAVTQLPARSNSRVGVIVLRRSLRPSMLTRL